MESGDWAGDTAGLAGATKSSSKVSMLVSGSWGPNGSGPHLPACPGAVAPAPRAELLHRARFLYSCPAPKLHSPGAGLSSCLATVGRETRLLRPRLPSQCTALNLAYRQSGAQ